MMCNLLYAAINRILCISYRNICLHIRQIFGSMIRSLFFIAPHTQIFTMFLIVVHRTTSLLQFTTVYYSLLQFTTVYYSTIQLTELQSAKLRGY